MKYALILSILFISVALADEDPRQVTNRRKLAGYLFPHGIERRDLEKLDKVAAGEGNVKYRDGKRFDRSNLQTDILAEIIMLTDLEAFELRKQLRDFNGRKP